MKDSDREKQHHPETFGPADQETAPIETDATTGSEGGGPGIGFGPNPPEEHSSEFDRSTSNLDRNRATGSPGKSVPPEGDSLRFVPTSIHGMMDYLLGAFLIAAPWLFGLNYAAAEGWILVAIGAAIIFYSLLTAYELGLVAAISMQAHLGLDILGGIVLAASPWLFGFVEVVWIPHLVLGLVEIGLALITRTMPSYVPHSGRTSPSRS